MIPLVSTGFALAGLLWFSLYLWRFPAQVALLSLAVVLFLDCLGLWTEGINAGVFIYPDDIACMILMAAAAAVAIQTRTLRKSLCMPGLLLFGLAAMNFLRGAVLFGQKPAGNGARKLVHLLVPFLVFGVIRPAIRVTFPRVAKWLCGAAILLTAVALCRWAGVLPIPEYEYIDDFRQIPRVLPSDSAMIIGQGLIAIVGLQLIRGFRITGMVAISVLATVDLALQHRSVWSATAVGLGWLAFRSMRFARKQWRQLAAASIAFALLAGVLLVASGKTQQLVTMLQSNADELDRQDSTLEWRLNGFSEAIDRAFTSGPVETLVGPPAGRDITDIASEASIHIHNRYIDTLAYYGVAGLILLVATLVKMTKRIGHLRETFTGRSTADVTGPILEAVFVSELTYFLVYFGGLLHGALLGWLWMAASAHERPAEQLTAEPGATLMPEPVLT